MERLRSTTETEPFHDVTNRQTSKSAAGGLAGVRQERESYERVIIADAWSDGKPAPKLLVLRRELLTPRRS